MSTRIRGGIAALIAVGAAAVVWSVVVIASSPGRAVDSPSSNPPDRSGVEKVESGPFLNSTPGYWTPERMRSAKPATPIQP
ncbi:MULTISPECIES: hypothetical protein [Actinoalloteichus]|uniref:Uncharacterized protein n=1 Tax=Actinoalloteichus fjordicus TaxID=1612552 RepID=A0AAC9LGE2_9PSEU|nr:MULTISPECIES: hypothetical protein [Actinoalloteichus]APU15880.1 hypothetical protein UA74_19275 [Actinoalloteichus fjordicus]APU21942.1 hypothetical protein UA75_19765 [Actinoalloteichus sp. GBA129-24]